MRVLVCGGRDYRNITAIHKALDEIKPSVVISGCATGADNLAMVWAEKNGVAIDPYPAKWQDITHPNANIRMWPDGTRYDARAGTRRNQQMIDEGKPDLVLAFPGGSGTADMVWRAERAGVAIRRIR